MIPAATVTYHPDTDWPDRLAALCREHSRIVVVDNSTRPDAQTFVATAIAACPGATLLSLPDNPGIGAALNLAFKTLDAEGHARVVAYDQDSTPTAGFVVAITTTADANPRAAVIGANWTDPRRPDSPALFLRSGPPLRLGFSRVPATCDLDGLICVITSGSLFDLTVWRSIDGFTADLFLDLVDTDYCLRARRAGYDIAASAAARLSHHRGDKRPVRLLGREFYPAHMPLFRLHCLARNRILLFRRHGFRPLAWTIYELAYAAKLVLDAVLFEKNSISRLVATLHGTWDGLLGRFGPVRSRP